MHSLSPFKKGLAHDMSLNYYFLILKRKQRVTQSLIFLRTKKIIKNVSSTP